MGKWLPTQAHPYGVGDYTLCAPCNNQTGGIYGQAFCDFVNKMVVVANETSDYRKPIKISYKGFLHRILKQILVMFCSANGEEFSKIHKLPSYLLDFKSKEFPADMRIYIMVVNRQSKIMTGIQGTLDLKDGSTLITSEILFWPLGYILTFSELKHDSIEGAYLTEITHWKDHDVDKRATEEFEIHKNYRLTLFPLDFRSKEEIEKLTGVPLTPPGIFPMIDYEI